MIHRRRSLILVITCFSIMFGINPSFAGQSAISSNVQGKVRDVIDVASYTYAEVELENTTVWAAAPTTKLKIGSIIAFSTEMPMEDFHSDSINKTFPLIYFVSRFILKADKAVLNGKPSTVIKPVAPILKGIEKVKGGKTIAEIYAEKESLKGKKVQVRAQVTRFSAEIMGKNWLHIQDSSSSSDLTVTTSKTVAVGDIVVIEGVLEVDKDFSHGYVYSAIIEDADVLKK